MLEDDLRRSLQSLSLNFSQELFQIINDVFVRILVGLTVNTGKTRYMEMGNRTSSRHGGK